MANPGAPFHPIIYVRGYAMSKGEINETTADPFCGFNLGSTVHRATPEKEHAAKKFIFESPVVRLRSDFEYTDVFENGLDIMDDDWEPRPRPSDNGKPAGISNRSIIIYRYYDKASTLLGDDERPEIEEFAQGLSGLILRVKKLVCANKQNAIAPEDFRCYLVAHSMGGLVCRAFLQNPKLGDAEALACVDKFFTFATPHNGIDMAGFNVPSWLSANDINNFSRDRMADYLNLKPIFKKTDRVDWLPEKFFDPQRVFCMIGTNRSDYEAAQGLSRTFAGHGSDGLVRIENASIWGTSDNEGKDWQPCASAYAYRSHSGFFGIVNSEESYQNLIRFLFGDVRVDIWLDIDAVRLPKELDEAVKSGKVVNALYQFELLASPRGCRWYLTRRVAEEDSVACRTQKELTDPANTKARSIYLSSVFLGHHWKVNKDKPSLAYGLTLGVRVPDYELDRKFWRNAHFEGGYLFHDNLVLELFPPEHDGEPWKVDHDWQADNRGHVLKPLVPSVTDDDKIELTVPFDNDSESGPTFPGISGKLRFVASEWNA